MSIKHERYNRQIILSEVGVEGQKKLNQSKVLIIGAGGLGSPVLQYLNACGIGTIGIIDHDIVSLSNLQRQVLFTESEIGQLKVDVARKRLLEQNSSTDINTYSEKLTSANAIEIIKNYDLIVDCCDNFQTRYILNDACVILKKKWVFGSIFKFEGQVSLFDGENGPTYRCLYPDLPTDSPNCNVIGVVGVLPGIIGALQANEVIKSILNIGNSLNGKLLVLDALTLEQKIIKFKSIPSNLKISSVNDNINLPKLCSSNPEEISVQDLKKLINSKLDFQLIDVREQFEYETKNLGGINIPTSELSEKFEQIDTSKKVVIICQSGVRSMNTLHYLKQRNPQIDAFSVKGGINQFLEETD